MHNLRNARSRAQVKRNAIARILATYDMSSDSVRAEGHAWYPAMLTICEGIAEDYGIPLERVVGAMAALSPQCSVQDNIEICGRVCEAYALNPYAFPARSGQTVDRVETALQILGGDLSPMDWLLNANGTRKRSMKTRSFYRNILGDENEVTIDTWAARIALGYRPDRQPDGPLYLLLADAYRDAAHARGVPPRVMQAIVWTRVRGSAW